MSTVVIGATELLPMIEEAENGILKKASKHVGKTVRVVASRGWWRDRYITLPKSEKVILDDTDKWIRWQGVQPYTNDRKTLQGLRVLCTMSNTIVLSTEDALVLNRYS